ncbi:MAG: DUF86 domain-containing protein [Deltaproteobacteria bacterium]|nr:MAG: DUF86 domain-containing protein [Deltaproteobacteria bacterium]
MVDREVFDRRLEKVEHLLVQLRTLAEVDKSTFLKDEGLKAQCERWLHLVAEACIDLANHLIADRGWPAPGSYRESFSTLAERGVIDEELSERMERWASLRNVLVHMYMDIDHEILFEILKNDLDQIEKFARQMAEFVG